MEEQLYYYKNGKTLLIAKHELTESEIGNYERITKKEYDSFCGQSNDKGNHEQSSIDEKRNRIAELKGLLYSSDYKQAKWIDGELTDEEYAPIKAQRHAWRVRIRELRAEIENAQ